MATREVTGQLGPPTTLLPSSDLPPPAWGRVDATGEQSLKHHGFVRVRFQTQSLLESDSIESLGTPDLRTSAAAQDIRAQLRSRVLCGTRQYL